MTEFKIMIEKIENGLLVMLNEKRFYFKNTYHVGKYLSVEIEKFLDEIDEINEDGDKK